MEIIIPVSDEEKSLVKEAIKELNKIGHLKNMSQTMIANTSGIKSTKIRHILQELVDSKEITQYIANDNIRLKRYYYVVNEQVGSSS